MVGGTDVGQHQTLTRKLAKALASAAIVGTLAFGAWGLMSAPTNAGGESRTISLYHIHTKERLTVTYMVNGRYVPSAMKQINHLMRDWRRDETIVIDPKTIDLMWELHADLGSKAPISIVCGYRSPKTNAFLKRIGRKVARKSQHMKGNAIDFFFPDVATKKIRNVALAHRMGGVGYYSSAGGPTGFIHADSGNVRQWGPGMRGSQVASYIRDGQKYMGKRSGRKLWSSTQVASTDQGNKKSGGGLLGLLIGNKKAPEEAAVAADTATENSAPAPVEAIYGDADEELADLSADAAAAQSASERTKLKMKAPTPVDEPYGLGAEGDGVANGELAALADSAATDPAMGAGEQGRKLPKPRLKPRAVLAMAEAKAQGLSVQIEPASAPPETQNLVKKPSLVVAALGSLSVPKGSIEGPLEDASMEQTLEGLANPEGKSSLTEGDVIIKPVIAALSEPEPSWWSFLAPDVEADLRRNGLPPGADDMKTDILPVAVELGPDGTGPATSLDVQSSEDGKGDSVNYEGKGSLPETALQLSSRSGLENDTTAIQ
jgi:uncharacterized protein YcbK (DUF882 family)